MMNYVGQFKLSFKGVDATFVGIETASSKDRAYHLCPYSTVKVKEALSFDGTKKRISLIDKAIMKSMKL